MTLALPAMTCPTNKHAAVDLCTSKVWQLVDTELLQFGCLRSRDLCPSTHRCFRNATKTLGQLRAAPYSLNSLYGHPTVGGSVKKNETLCWCVHSQAGLATRGPLPPIALLLHHFYRVPGPEPDLVRILSIKTHHGNNVFCSVLCLVERTRQRWRKSHYFSSRTAYEHFGTALKINPD